MLQRPELGTRKTRSVKPALGRATASHFRYAAGFSVVGQPLWPFVDRNILGPVLKAANRCHQKSDPPSRNLGVAVLLARKNLLARNGPAKWAITVLAHTPLHFDSTVAPIVTVQTTQIVPVSPTR